MKSIGILKTKTRLIGRLNRKAVYIGVKTQEKSVSPLTEKIIVVPDEGYTGLSQVTVSAVDSTIDSNILPENIRKDTTILGVTGTLETEGVTAEVQGNRLVITGNIAENGVVV